MVAHVFYVDKNKPRTKSVYGDRTFASLPEYVEYLRTEVGGKTQGERYKNVRHRFEIVPFGETQVVRATLTFEDHGVPNQKQVHLLRAEELYALHPDTGRPIHVAVSERHPRGQEPMELGSVAERFLNSLRFEPVQ